MPYNKPLLLNCLSLDMFFTNPTLFIFAQAFKMHKKRLDLFSEIYAPETEAMINATLKLGRATIIEKTFFDSLNKQLVNEAERKNEINNTVSKMDGADLTIDDVDVVLWKCCQEVVNAKRLS